MIRNFSRWLSLCTLGVAFSVSALTLPKIFGGGSKGPYWTEKNPADRKALQAKLDEINQPIVSLAQGASPAVVTVLTTSEIQVPQMMVPDEMFEFFFGMPGMGGQGGGRGRPRTQKAQSLGSGFVISPDGIIVTNSHVVRLDESEADSVRVKFLGDSIKSEGEEVEILGVDPIVDTAVLRLKRKGAANLAVLPFGNSDSLKVGEWVVAIGNPHGLSNTVTKGIVSALGRDIIPEVSADFIQTDASINQGNSGGPLLNLAGEVVGINTAIDPKGQGLGFAIPINTVKRAISGILAKGRSSHGFAGVNLMQDFDAEKAKALGLKNADGALLEDVTPGQPAAKAGLKAMDVVTKVGGRRVSTNSDFQKAVRELDPDTSVKVEFIRDGKPQSTTLMLGDLERDMKTTVLADRMRRGNRGDGERDSVTLERVGVRLTNITSTTRMRWNLGRSVQGVIISGVLAGSPADEAGITSGDIILKIQNVNVGNAKAAEKMMARSGVYTLSVLRGNTVNRFDLKI